jgi:hypothetical protein
MMLSSTEPIQDEHSASDEGEPVGDEEDIDVDLTAESPDRPSSLAPEAAVTATCELIVSAM